MKRFLLLALMNLSAYIATAQDIIVTKQSERIDGKVEEISETEIKYRKSNDPSNQLFIISPTRVASIIFENGEVYTPPALTAQPQQQYAEPPMTTTGVQFNSSIVDDGVNERNREAISKLPKAFRKKLSPLIDGEGPKVHEFEHGLEFRLQKGDYGFEYYGDTIAMNSSEFRIFLYQNCPKAYKKYQVQYGIGIGLVAVGVCGVIAGLTGLLVGDDWIVGTIVSGSSTGMMLIAIPICMTAHRTAAKYYNRNCALGQARSPEMSVNFHSNGISFNF